MSYLLLDKAERRHVKIEDVSVTWPLNWIAEKLEVRLFGWPEDRPFQAHVVVEETVYSGEIRPENIENVLSDKRLREQIHTPFVTEMVNQLVFVTELFFKEERKAIEEGENMWREFEQRSAEQAPIGPIDPVESVHKAIREMAPRSSSTLTLAAAMDEQMEYGAW